MATPSHNKLRKKRTNKRKKKRKPHQRSYSEGLASTKYNFKEYKVPRKLGPVDIGRNKYKGTKYVDKNTHSFLKEKIHPLARSASFHKRKKNNPLPKRLNLSEIGTPNSWKKPAYFDAESERMKRNTSRLDFLLDNKPMHTRDKSLDSLKHSHIPKGLFATDTKAPFSWKPIEYEFQQDKNDFLTEKFWFESSKINFDLDDGMSKVLQTLPPEKLVLISHMPPPTGYQSKIHFLQKLKQIVLEEARESNNYYALNLLNVYQSTLTLDALSDNESDNNLQKNKNMNDSSDMFNMSLGALNDGSESENLSVEIHISDDENEPKTSENHFQFNFESVDDALEEILAPSPSPIPHSEDSYTNDAILDQEMEDALSQILAPSPSPQPIASPQSSIDEKDGNSPNNDKLNVKRLRRRELLKTVQMNLEEIHNKTSVDNIDTSVANVSETNDDILDLNFEKSEMVMTAVASNEESYEMNVDALIQNVDQLKEAVSDIGKKEKKNKGYFKSKIPPDFICPISKDIISEAVMASDGRIYDRKNIEKWLELNDISPISKTKLRHKNLMVFNELTNRINFWKIKNISKKKRRKKRKSLKKKATKIENIELGPLCSSPLGSPLSPLSGNEGKDGMNGMNKLDLSMDIDGIGNISKDLEIGNDSSDLS